MYKVTTVRLSDETIKALENLTEKLQREKSDLMREALQIGIREIKLLHAIDQYRAGKISFGKMSELSGLGYRELYAELRKRNIPQRYGETRFREEINQLVDWLIAVSDAGPLIWLARRGILQLLRNHYREIIIPEAVFTEAVTRGLEKGYPDAQAIKKAVGESWIKVQKTHKRHTDRLKAVETETGIQLGAGERETLALALETPRAFVLTNDEDAYLVARLLETRSKGVLYLLLKSVKEGYLTKSQVRDHMGKMLEEGFWLSPSVVHAFHEALNKL